jgi:hypothetical protein
MRRSTVTYLPMKDLSTKDNEQESAANCQAREIRTSQDKLKEQGFALHPLSGVGHSELSKVLIGSDETIPLYQDGTRAMKRPYGAARARARRLEAEQLRIQWLVRSHSLLMRNME